MVVSSNNELLDSDIVFWDGRLHLLHRHVGCGVVPNAAYIEDIAAHEFGHALGLNHSTSTDATMYPSYSYCSMAFRTLATDDINGAKALYPTTTVNSAPSVTISSPANGSSYASGAAVTFTGSANDTQDGLLTAALAWTSNIDGTIGLGGSFTRVLSAGTHTIKATAVDSGGLTTVRQVSVIVASCEHCADGQIASPGYRCQLRPAAPPCLQRLGQRHAGRLAHSRRWPGGRASTGRSAPAAPSARC